MGKQTGERLGRGIEKARRIRGKKKTGKKGNGEPDGRKELRRLEGHGEKVGGNV